MRVAAFVSVGCLAAVFGFAQQPAATAPSPAPVAATASVLPVPTKRIDPTNSYYRVLAIVPLTGSGTHADPVRPMFAPAPSAASNRNGIIAYQHQLSDDGKLAIVEFVATTRAAFAPLLASTDSRVKVFEVGQHTKAEITAAFQTVKADFSFDKFQPLPVY